MNHTMVNPVSAAPVSAAESARIVADVGGTNARFATVGSTASALQRIDVLACADYPRISLVPTNDHEMALLRELIGQYGRVSIERVLSGPGLENLYRANARVVQAHPGPPWKRAPEITELAEADDFLARQTVTDFLDILGTFAGDMALVAWAMEGVYLSGGVLRELMRFFDATWFRARFEDKGRFREFCERVPVAWITAEYPGLLGCAAALAAAKDDLPPR